QAGELEPLSHPLRQLVEVQRLVEDDAGAPLAVPADLTLGRPETFDDDKHLLAHAIFPDGRNLDPSKRDIVHVDRVVGLSDPDRGLARDLEPWRAGPEAVPWPTPCG